MVFPGGRHAGPAGADAGGAVIRVPRPSWSRLRTAAPATEARSTEDEVRRAPVDDPGPAKSAPMPRRR